MISETAFRQLVGDLHQTNTAKHTEFWKHVANIANNESPLRDYLETVLKSKEFNKTFKSDVMSSDMELRSAVVLAIGYCVARPQLARHMDIKVQIEQILKATTLSSYNKQIAIKCVWAVANVKQPDALKQLADNVMALICDLVKHKFLKDDVAVHKEILRLMDKMLLTAPKTCCQFSYLPRWLVCVVNLTVSKLQVIREKAAGLLEKHMTVLLGETDNEVDRIIAQQLFSLSTVSNIAKPTSWLLQELQQLANTGHSVYVIGVWVSLVNMTSKFILKRAAYLNELFSVPDFFTKHLTDNASRIALFDSWIRVIDIYRSNIPEFFANSKHMKFFMTPFFTIKQPSLEVSLALVKSWWYLVVACHRLKYMNNFTAVLEPCIKMCFKHQEAGALVQRGADILYLLLDCEPPQCDLASISPSSLNLSDSIHCHTFLKYYDMLIRYKPNCKGLIIPIWSRLCDCTKGAPDGRSMMSVLHTAAKCLYPINVLSMIESLCQSSILTTLNKAQLAQLVLQCASKDDKLLSIHLTKLLKSVPFEDNQYLKFLSEVLDLISEKPGDKKDLRVQSKISVWESASVALAEFAEQTGGQLNEGTRIKPEFSTTHSTVTVLFKLFDRSHSEITQSSIQSACQKWERLVSLYIEHTSQYCAVNVTEQLISHILDTYLDTILLYPLIYCSKVLVEESPVPQLSLLQISSSPVFKLVSNVLHLVHNESRTSDLSPPILSLCIELCASSWNLLTPGRVIPILTEIKDSFLGLVSRDKQYPTSLQNIVQTCYTTLLSSVLKHLTFYNDPELACLEDYLIYGLKHSKKVVRVSAASFWNSTFGIKHSGPYSEKLRTVIQQEAKRSALIVPSSANVSMERSHSQSTEMADSTSKSMQVPLRGSFLRRKKDLHVEVEDPKPSPKITETYARSSKKAAKKQSAATPPRTRSVHKRQVAEDSQDCIFIPSSPKKQKILTKHQKEKIIEQRMDRNVPVMYNSLDLNSQEPFLFDNSSQSQALPSEPTTPEKVLEPPAAKPATPGFSSKRLLFLSPMPNKATASEAKQTLKTKIATLPLTSPSPDIISSQSEHNNSPSDSEEDLYCDTTEEPDSTPVDPPEPVITPPESEKELLDSGIELQPSQLPSNPDLIGNESFTPEDSNSKTGMISNVIKSMISYVVPNMVKPSSLTIVPSDNDKSDETGSQSSGTTPSELKTSSDTTPVDSKSSSENSPNVSDTSIKSTPLVPPETLIDTISGTLAETSTSTVVLVEDSQNIVPDKTSASAVTAVPDSVTGESPETGATERKEKAPDIEQFSNDISFSDCSTARESSYKLSKAIETDDTDPAVGRRSSRLLIKRIKSDDQGVKESPLKFKRVKSVDDVTDTPIDPAKLLTPIKESDELSQLRKSVRPRKSSARLRDDSFITTNVPASILNTNSKDENGKELEISNVESQNSTIIATKLPPEEVVVKKKRGRPRKTLSEIPSSLESPRKKVNKKATNVSTTAENVPVITIPDSQSGQNSPVSSENSVVCLGEVTSDVSKQDNILIPDTPVVETSSFADALKPSHSLDKTGDKTTTMTPVPESAAAVSGQDISGDDQVKNIPDSQVSVPDSQPVVSGTEAEPQASSEVRKKRGRSSRRLKNLVVESETVKTPTQSLIKSRKSPRLSATPPDARNLITDYLSKSPKPPTINSNDTDETPPPLSVELPKNTNQKVQIETSSTEDDSAASKISVSQSIDNNISKTATQSVQNDSESLTQSLAANFQLTEEDDSLSLELLPLPPPSEDISPQETESIPSSSSQRKPRKQAKPKKTAPVRSRKSQRLTSKSQTLENAAKEKQGEKDPDAAEETLSQKSSIINLHSQVLVPDSLQVQEQDTQEHSEDSQISKQTKGKLKKDLENIVSDSEVGIESMSQILSLDVTSSDKKNLLSPDTEPLEFHTPQKNDDLQSPGYNESPASVSSVEAFGKPVTKLEFNVMPCTPNLGLDTLADSAESETEGLVVDTLQDPVTDTMEDPTGDTLPDPVENTLQDPVNTLDLEEDTLPDPVVETLQDPVEDLVADSCTDQTTTSPDLEDSQVPANVLKPSSPYKELEEYPETETSVTFCSNSQIPPSQQDTKKEADHSYIPDSQAVTEDPGKLVEIGTSRSLKRKPSIPSNLPDVMQDLVAVEMSMAENMEVEVKTPPKSLQLGVGEPNTPTTPKTPSSILKKTNEPGSGSPSLSRRHVTFGPLPEPHRDPNEVTPRRHSKFRKSPAPPQPKIRQPEPNSSEESVFPSLVHSTVRAHDIIRTLCTGFTLSQRNFNLSIVSSTIKTIGDLARLTPSQIEEYPFITPKLIQVRRNLKKFEASQTPMFSVKSFLSETKARDKSQKSETESSEPVVEVASDENKEQSQTKSEEVTESRQFEAQEGKENVADPEGLMGDETEPMATELEDEDKENRDPNDKHISEELKTKPGDQTKTAEVIEIPSTQNTEETLVSDSEPIAVPEEDSVQAQSLFNANLALPTTDALAESKENDKVTVIQNSLSKTAATRNEEIITVGRPENSYESKEEVQTSISLDVSTQDTSSELRESEISAADESSDSTVAFVASTKPTSEVGSENSELDPEIEINSSFSPPKESQTVVDTSLSTVPASESSEESQATASVICEDTSEDSLGLTCHEELSLSCEMKRHYTLDSPSIIAETTSESSQSISQDIAKTISEGIREGEGEIQGQIVESQDEIMDYQEHFKLGSTDSGTTNSSVKPDDTASICSLLNDIPGLGKDVITPADDSTSGADNRALNRDESVSDDVTTPSEITNPLVDYPLTQPPPLVDYPLTQDTNSLSFEEEIRQIEQKLSMISDPGKRHIERYKIIERLCLNGRKNS